MQRPTVVLPDPDSPTSPSVSPRLMSNETPSTALTSATWREKTPAMMGKYFSRSRTATRVSAAIPCGPAAATISGAMTESPFADNRGCGLRRRAQFAEIDVLVVLVQNAAREMAVAEID